jgi:hypothetical protein
VVSKILKGLSGMSEKEIERRMCELVRKRGGITYKFTSPNNPGVPDRIVITPGGAVWFVELKTASGRLANIQKWQKGELEKRNANVRVIRGWDAAKEFIEEVMPNGI